MSAATGLRLRRVDRFSRSGWWVVVLMTMGAFLPLMRNDFVDWDDLNMIVRNPLFNPPTWSGVGWYWVHPAWNLYQPMTTTAWAALAWAGWVSTPDHFGGHMNPAVFHLASAVLHALAAGFLLRILQRVLKSRMPAVIGALLFALHPLQVEPVAFAGTVNAPLSEFFLLLAMDLYLAAVDPRSGLSSRRRGMHLVISTAALLLAMLTRPSAVVGAPIAVALELAAFHRPLRLVARSIAPWLVLTVACAIWTHAFEHGEDAARSPVWFRPIVASDAVWFYIRKILLPMHLCIEYDRTPAAIRQIRFIAFTLLAPAMLLILGAWCRRTSPLLTAAIVIFLVALLPNSGLLPFDWERVSTVADRYASLSLIGVALAAGLFLKTMPRFIPFAAAVLLLLTAATEYQITTWADGPTLYRHALAINPDAWYSAGNLASVISDQSPEQAIALCRQSIHLKPDQPDVWNTLGSILMGQHHRPEAIRAFQMASNLAPDEPLFRDNLARASHAAKTAGMANQSPPSLP